MLPAPLLKNCKSAQKQQIHKPKLEHRTATIHSKVYELNKYREIFDSNFTIHVELGFFSQIKGLSKYEDFFNFQVTGLVILWMVSSHDNI